MGGKSKKRKKESKNDRKKDAKKKSVARTEPGSKKLKNSKQETPPAWAQQTRYIPRYPWDSSG
jgi:hypothetical protein